MPPMRLSPRVLLIDPVRILPSLFLPLVGVLFVGGFSPGSFVWAALGILGSIGYAVVRWATFSYQIVGDRLELTRALISRSIRTIPLERVRGVDIATPPMHRLFGLAVLRIDTGAGGGAQEGELDGVTVAEAERLQVLLQRHGRARRAPDAMPGSVPGPVPGSPPGALSGALPGSLPGPPSDPQTPPASGVSARAPGEPVPDPMTARPAPRVFLRVPRRWLVYGPLSGAYLLTPFALAAGAVGLAFQWGEGLGLGRETAWGVAEWLWARPYLLLLVLLLLVLAMPVVGAVMYAVLHWDFTLAARDGYLVAERGLITRRSVSLERRRVRGYEMVEGLIERSAGMMRGWAIVTGLGDTETRGQLLPVVPRTEATRVLGAAIGRVETPLRPHPPAARKRRLFRAVAPWLAWTVLVAVAAVLTGSGIWWVLAAVGLVPAALGVPLGLDRYRSLGHTYDGTRLSVRSGSLRRSQAVIERRAVVGWTLSQTWFQRRAGVLTVIVGVGAGSGGYAAIDVSEAGGPAFAAEVTPDWIVPFRRTDAG